MENQQLWGKTVCSCGATHLLPIKVIDIGSGAIGRIVHSLTQAGISGKQATIVADDNTWEAAGKCVEHTLKKEGYIINTSILEGKPQVIPDESSVAKALSDVSPVADFIIAVGSGTINDIVRYIAHRLGKPYISIGTAPSMDGYASVISALLINGVKITHYADPPVAIIADINVISKAPHKMVMAGFGDMLAKLVSIADWRLGTALMGEQWCLDIAKMSTAAMKKVLDAAESIKDAREEGIQALTEALVTSGMAIIMAGHTRPASGGEHHIAHYLEMKLFSQGRPQVLHGIKVGMGTLASVAFYNKLADVDPDSIDVVSLMRRIPDDSRWIHNIEEAFGSIAQGIKEEADPQYRDKSLSFSRLENIKAIWDCEIKPIIKDLPSLENVKEWTKSAGFEFSPDKCGITYEMLHDALKNAMEVRSRYTILRLISDLGLLEKVAEELVSEKMLD